MGGNILNDRCCDVPNVTGIKHSRDERVHIEREREKESPHQRVFFILLFFLFFSYFSVCNLC